MESESVEGSWESATCSDDTESESEVSTVSVYPDSSETEQDYDEYAIDEHEIDNHHRKCFCDRIKDLNKSRRQIRHGVGPWNVEKWSYMVSRTLNLGTWVGDFEGPPDIDSCPDVSSLDSNNAPSELVSSRSTRMLSTKNLLQLILDVEDSLTGREAGWELFREREAAHSSGMGRGGPW